MGGGGVGGVGWGGVGCVFFFFNDTATTEIYTLSLHDALPIWLWKLPLIILAVFRVVRLRGVAERRSVGLFGDQRHGARAGAVKRGTGRYRRGMVPRFLGSWSGAGTVSRTRR